MGRLTADFAKAFSRDLKKNAKRRNWNLTELEKVIDLVVEKVLSVPDSIRHLQASSVPASTRSTTRTALTD